MYTFEQALDLLQRGHKVARKIWHQPHYLQVENGVLGDCVQELPTHARHHSGHNWRTAPVDVLATDWMIIA